MNEFTEIAEDVLGDLLGALGFVRVDKAFDLAIFESATCTLTVGHDSQRSSEVFLGLNRRDGTYGPDFDFGEVVRAASVPSRLQPTGYAVRDEKSVRSLLQTMAKLLAAYCVPLLRGEGHAWSKLVSQRDATRYADENLVRLALNDAIEAWHVKNFAKFIEILGPVRHLLGASDLAKLEYAEQKLHIG
ncbi:MAG: hypothetical protein IPF50_00690 [Proteobacteria bacterium]|nr:hypothetical protein [Pseudomonadota bacterium]